MKGVGEWERTVVCLGMPSESFIVFVFERIETNDEQAVCPP